MIPDCKIILRPSPIEGVGVFANSNIKKGEYPFTRAKTYKILTRSEFESLCEEMQYLITRYSILQENGDYYSPFDLRHIDFSGFLNHSESPNIDTNELFALKDISKGEELTVDYNILEDLDSKS